MKERRRGEGKACAKYCTDTDTEKKKAKRAGKEIRRQIEKERKRAGAVLGCPCCGCCLPVQRVSVAIGRGPDGARANGLFGSRGEAAIDANGDGGLA